MKAKKQEFEIENQTIIEAVLPMITIIDGKEFFFFTNQDESYKSFAVQCPGGTFESLRKQLETD